MVRDDKPARRRKCGPIALNGLSFCHHLAVSSLSSTEPLLGMAILRSSPIRRLGYSPNGAIHAEIATELGSMNSTP